VSKHGCDEVVSLGDVIDVKISKKSGIAGPLPPLQVADDVDLLAALVEPCRLLRGNQEERFERLTAAADRSPAMNRLVEAPQALRDVDTVLVHGHHFEWINPRDDLWLPEVGADDARVVVHGHRHRRQLLRRPADAVAGTGYEELAIELGQAVCLAEPGLHYLVDIGPAFVDGAWLLYDDNGPTVTWHRAAD
jgi:predicted phosphodiesterase